MRLLPRVLLPAAVFASGLALALAGCSAMAAAAPKASATSTTSPIALRGPTAAPGRQVIAALGDSIMNGHGLQTGQDWPTLLADDRDETVYNVSCDGGGFVAVGDCGTDFAGLIPAALQEHPDIVMVQGSDNDQAQSEAALTAATTATVLELHHEFPHARILGINTLWNQPTAPPAEIAYSSKAVENAVENVGGTYIDIGQPLAGHSDLVQSDNEHPTAKGQKVLLADVESACDAIRFPL
jgi:acyl-CoA thioesterase-1